MPLPTLLFAFLNSFAIVQISSLPLFCHHDVFHTWRGFFHNFYVSLTILIVVVVHALKVALLSVIRFPSIVKSILRSMYVFVCANFFLILDPSSYISPSKLNRFFVFVSHRLHFVLYYCIDRCANARSSNNTPFQMIRFSTSFSFISMMCIFLNFPRSARNAMCFV